MGNQRIVLIVIVNIFLIIGILFLIISYLNYKSVLIVNTDKTKYNSAESVFINIKNNYKEDICLDLSGFLIVQEYKDSSWHLFEISPEIYLYCYSGDNLRGILEGEEGCMEIKTRGILRIKRENKDYCNLPPGKYRFMEKFNNDIVFSNEFKVT